MRGSMMIVGAFVVGVFVAAGAFVVGAAVVVTFEP